MHTNIETFSDEYGRWLKEEWFAKDQTNKVDHFAKFHRYLNRKIQNSKAKIEKKDAKTVPVVNAEVRTRVKRKCTETSPDGHEDTSVDTRDEALTSKRKRAEESPDGHEETSVDTRDEASTSKRKRAEESPDRGPKMITAVAEVHRNAPDISESNVTVRPSNSFSIRSLLSESRNETTPSARATNYDYIDYDSKGFTGNINNWLHTSMGIVQQLL